MWALLANASVTDQLYDISQFQMPYIGTLLSERSTLRNRSNLISIAVQFFRFYMCSSASALHVSHASGQWVVAPRAEVFVFRFHVRSEESWDSAQKFQAHRLIPLQSLLCLCNHKERGTQPPSAHSLKLYCVWSQSVQEKEITALCSKNIKCEARPYRYNSGRQWI